MTTAAPSRLPLTGYYTRDGHLIVGWTLAGIGKFTPRGPLWMHDVAVVEVLENGRLIAYGKGGRL